ncbi:vigilin [Nephila pilipes]|uniref:Vigilin n=1 Tax=Nephila pilipes TaxID=299642 RepID=A0A8X6TL54_NEPPI|nr:vigilin [Nephila pilipes]
MNEEMKLTYFVVEEPIYKHNYKFIIRKDGENIKKLRDETNTKIDLQTEGEELDIIAIRGTKDVMKANKRLEITNEKPLVGNTAEIKANLEPHKFLIGRNGASIKKVLDNTGARNVFHNENDDDKITITIIEHHDTIFGTRGSKVQDIERQFVVTIKCPDREKPKDADKVTMNIDAHADCLAAQFQANFEIQRDEPSKYEK